MSGLIWAGIGQGIANAGRSMGDYMAQDAREEERQKDRLELQRERLASTERENERARQSREQMAAERLAMSAGGRGGGADGGLSPKSFAEGGENELMLAQRAGMTVPEMRARDRLSMTGDTEAYKQGVTRYSRLQDDTAGPNDEYSDAVSRKGAMLVEETVKELPPGFEAEARAKAQALAKIKESYVLGGKYDDVTKGRRNQQEVDMSEAALRQPGASGVIGQAMAAGAGKDLVGGDSNVTRNKFTGETSVTPVGESVRSENLAQAGQAAAAGRKSEADAGRINDRSDPETMRMRADYTQRERTLRTQISKAFGDEKTTLQSDLAELVAERKAFEDQVSAKKASAPTAAPSGGGALPEPKTPEEVAKLKPGTRFKAPDGSIRYK